VRIVSCLLLRQSPWPNAIVPKWVHAKRKVVEPDGLLGAYELAKRVCRVFGCPHYEHLSVTQNVARSCTRRKVIGQLWLTVHLMHQQGKVFGRQMRGL